MPCKACGLEHRGWVSCAKAKADEAQQVANADPPAFTEMVLVVNTESKHGKYADKEKRLAYMRELMRKRRAG